MTADANRVLLEKRSSGRRAGFGKRPALAVMDSPDHLVGRPGDDDVGGLARPNFL